VTQSPTEPTPSVTVTSDSPTTSPQQTTSTSAPITSAVPSSTPVPSSPSTTPATTTAQSTSTTTKVPETTTKAPTTTSTKAPETTTTQVTSSTPSPPSYPANRGTWAVSNVASPDSNCILFEGAFRLEVSFLAFNETVQVDIPKDATATGLCDSDGQQSLSLTWNLKINSVQMNAAFDIIFEMNNATQKYTISSINASTDSGKCY